MWRLSGLPRWAAWGPQPLMSNFKELLLWNVANTDETAQDLPMMNVDLSSTETDASPTRAEDPLSLNLRELWCSYDRLHQLPPQLSLCSTSPPRHDCLQWPWELVPLQGRQKILPGLWEQSLLPPGSNSPTHFSLSNLTQQLSWLCPVYLATVLANWAQDTGCKKHTMH